MYERVTERVLRAANIVQNSVLSFTRHNRQWDMTDSEHPSCCPVKGYLIVLVLFVYAFVLVLVKRVKRTCAPVKELFSRAVIEVCKKKITFFLSQFILIP